ncbi:MAG: asparaginase [Pyrinomonadaceae bacterium]
MNSEILAHVIRGETVESIHRGHIVAIDGDGNEVVGIGDTSLVTYFRSAAKAFQFIPCITSGAADAFNFTVEEIAIAVASHSGEPVHVDIAKRLLTKIGLSESDLRCGVHAPFYDRESRRLIAAGEKPTVFHNNCSGKHTAMLAFAKHIGAELGDYDSIGNRIQQRILRCVADLSGVPEDEIAIGVDGCGVPSFALPLNGMARSFANLIAPARFPDSVQSAATSIVDAMLKYPELIGGTNRLDTIVMQAAPGKLISKVGAEGVWLCGVLPCDEHPTGLGIALKIEDGDDLYSRSVVAIEILRQVGVLSADKLTDLSPMPIKNRRGDTVGSTRAVLGFSMS